MKVPDEPRAARRQLPTAFRSSRPARPSVPPGKLRALIVMATRLAALAGIAATMILGMTSAASAATTTDKTCQTRAEGIQTCEWLDLTYSSQARDQQITTYAQMKGGTANREIIQIILRWKSCNYPPPSICAQDNADTSPIDLVGGTYTVSYHIGPVLCAHNYYRPKFQWKIYEGKSAGWVTGWSYGNWIPGPGNIKPCTVTG
jgi:hypothetical protein